MRRYHPFFEDAAMADDERASQLRAARQALSLHRAETQRRCHSADAAEPDRLVGAPGASNGDQRFADRRDAGRRLAAMLENTRGEDAVVRGLAADGMPVAAEVARALEAPLDVVVVEKVCAPENPDHEIGAVAEDESAVVDEETVERLGLRTEDIDGAIADARRRLNERRDALVADRPRLAVNGRSVILVDDGLAGPLRTQAAARLLRSRGARRIVLAVPVAGQETLQLLRRDVDHVVAIRMRDQMLVGALWYEDFSPTSAAEVRALLSTHSGAKDREVAIEASPGVLMHGALTVPWGAYARGVVVFAGGPDSSRLSPRNRKVARALNNAAIATLLLDVLTPYEQIESGHEFDGERLAERLLAATRWLRRQPETARIALGYFGAGTGSAAALLAAAQLKTGVCAVVSCGGRPDFAGGQLEEVVAPVLLIVGEADSSLVELNRAAQRRLRCETELAVVAGAAPLVDEPGAPDEVAQLTVDWFTHHLRERAPNFKTGDEHPTTSPLTGGARRGRLAQAR